MKKLTAVLLIAVCCIILSACNSGENETKITSQVTTSAVTTAKETIQPATTAAEQTTGTETTKAIEETTDLQEEVTQAQTTTAGDIVLYSGDQMVVFYGSNTWAYTRLGHITDKTQAELAELLSNGNVTVTLSY